MNEPPQDPQPPKSGTPSSVSLDVPPVLLQLADRFLQLRERESHLHAEESLRQSEEVKMEMNIGYQLQREQMQHERHQFNIISTIVTIVIVLLIALTAGIIFINKDTKTGLLIISHAAALASGWLMKGASNVHKGKGLKADKEDDPE